MTFPSLFTKTDLMRKKQAPTLKITNFQVGNARDEGLLALRVVSLYKRICRLKAAVSVIPLRGPVTPSHVDGDGYTR